MNSVIQEHTLPTGQLIQIVQGDLTDESVDVIVNAANAHLQHGGGVAGAIVRMGGSRIQDESNAWVRQYGPVSHGEPAFTSGGRLSCRFVIHAVGPMWGEGDEDNKLMAAVTGSLKRADKLELKSIALPAISTGIFGFPKDRAAGIIFGAIVSYFKSYPSSSIKQIRLTIIDQPTLAAFQQAFKHQFQILN